MASSQPSPDAVVTVKVNFEGVTRRSKMPLRDTAPRVLEEQIRNILHIPVDNDIMIERYSDSAASYVVLDQANVAVYKQLYRAAKAKSKLKLRVTVKKSPDAAVPKPVYVEEASEETPSSNDRTPTSGIAIASKTCSVSDSLSQPRDAASSMVRVYDTGFLAEAAKIAEASDLGRELRARVAGLGYSNGGIAQSDGGVSTMPQSLPDEQAIIPAIECARFAICCNSCEKTTQDVHYHCSTCDDGDFDLCEACVDLGITCHGSDHWLIKRTRVDGQIVASTTETIAPKPVAKAPTKPAVQENEDMESFADGTAFDAKAALSHLQETMAKLQMQLNMRTCNSCIQERPEQDFLHCQSCEDFDLCRDCFPKDVHGHHPKHSFAPAVAGTVMPTYITDKFGPGRKMVHHAICDNCDKFIQGVRHKCLECPDWDYCSDCVANSETTHPKHRFVPIYEHLKVQKTDCPASQSVHIGICCDGPLCSTGKGFPAYIRGTRYKCAVCHDVDYCGACEASPANQHNQSHPLIKFKSPVRHVSVTTYDEDTQAQKVTTLGDRCPARRTTGRSCVVPVQTVVDTKPEAPKVQVKTEECIKEEPKTSTERAQKAEDDLQAVFVSEEIRDGTILSPNQVFEQTWHLRNNGVVAWPAGCSVKLVGGDYMCNVDPSRPARTAELIEASETTACEAPVVPGEEFSFTVKLRTPARPGKVVSYWRLGTPEGIKFGHRLWCDVHVRDVSVESTSPVVRAAQAESEKAEKVEKVEKVEKPELQTSQMIFPKLEKESPMSSVHEEAPKQPMVEKTGSDDFEECSRDDDWDGSEMDDFLTDEEYDILDASDEELLEEQHKLLSK